MWISSQHSQRFSKKPGYSFKKGFTLIEMLVVMSIMVVITGALLIKQSTFNSSTVLRSLAYGVALSVRQAQVYGTSVIGTSTTLVGCGSGYYTAVSGVGTCYAPAYGLYFSSALSAASPSSYILFADLNNDGQYQPNEYVKPFNFSDGYVVSDICATEIGGNVDCWVGGTTAGLLAPNASLSIMFKRPNPDACFSTNLQTTACAVGGSPFYKSAYVEIQTKADTSNTKRVTITVPGEVMVGVAAAAVGGSGGGALACAPASQHAALDTYATYTASGGTPGYNWVIPNQGNGYSIVPSNGSGPTLQIKYTTAGTYSVPLYDSLVVTPQTCTLIIP